MMEKLAIILGGIVIVLSLGCYVLWAKVEAKDSKLSEITQRAEVLEANNQGLIDRNRIIDAQVVMLEEQDVERTRELSEYRTRMEKLREENQELRELLDTRIPAVCLFGLPIPRPTAGDE